MAVPIELPSSSSLESAALLSQLCGSIAFVFAARAARDLARAASCLELTIRHLKIPATIRKSPNTMTIVMPMDRIDPALRVAALDRDPGWIPWLNCTVRLEFEASRESETL
jgi:hypothetical protein